MPEEQTKDEAKEPIPEEPSCIECGQGDVELLVNTSGDDVAWPYSVCVSCLHEAYVEGRERRARREAAENAIELRAQEKRGDDWQDEEIRLYVDRHLKRARARGGTIGAFQLALNLEDALGIHLATSAHGHRADRETLEIAIVAHRAQEIMDKYKIDRAEALELLKAEVLKAMAMATIDSPFKELLKGAATKTGRPDFASIFAEGLDAMGKGASPGSAAAISMAKVVQAAENLSDVDTEELVKGIEAAHKRFSCEGCPILSRGCSGKSKEAWAKVRATEELLEGAEKAPTN
jgi:hypothetical protein